MTTRHRLIVSQFLLLGAIVGPTFCPSGPSTAQAQGTQQQYYDPVAIALLQRRINQVEAQVKSLEAQVANRQRQLDDAPKLIRPVQDEVAAAEKKHEASRLAVANLSDALRKADQGLRELKKALTKSIERDPAYQSAHAEREKSKANVDAIRATTDESLKDDTEYRRLAKTEAFYQARFDTVKEKQQSGEASPSDYLLAVKELEAAQRKREAFLEKQLTQNPAFAHANKLFEAADEKFETVQEELLEKALTQPAIYEFEKTIDQVKEQHRDAIKFTTKAKAEMYQAKAKISRMKRQAEAFIVGMNKLKRERDVLDRKVNGMVSRLNYLRSLPPRPFGQ